MPKNVFPIDQSKSMFLQDHLGHNRWHPDVPAAATVRPGEGFRMDCREWTDGQILNTDDANDVRDVDLSINHVLSGPVAVERAEPGDILVVDVLDMGPHLPDTAPDGLAGAELEKAASEATRTVPTRDHGGNMDIKNLSRGCRAYLPVYVDGAKLSVGDLHFSQGDGEISFCGAIEMGGWIEFGVDLIKVPAALSRPDRGPLLGHGGHPERLCQHLHPDRNLRLRHLTVGRRARQPRPREPGDGRLGYKEDRKQAPHSFTAGLSHG